MTVFRRLALKIAGFVVRHASPGSKEWAEGIAHEVHFIENDWGALGWAFSSVRVLFDYRTRPIRSFNDLTAAAETFAESKRHEVNNVWLATNARSLTMLIAALTNIPRLFLAIGNRERISNGMIVIGFITLAILDFVRSKEPAVPDRDDVPAIIRFYRSWLKRTSSLSSLDFWVFVVGSVLIGTGFELAKNATWEPFLGVVWLASIGFFLQMQRNNRIRLRQIEALFDTRPSDQ
jgi:hypothetical protein